MPSFSLLSKKAIFNSAPREFLKHAIPDYLVRGTDLFSLKTVKYKNDNSQRNNSHPVWINQNHTYIFDRSAKIYFLVCRRILVISVCVPWDGVVANHWSKSILTEQGNISLICLSWYSVIFSYFIKKIFFQLQFTFNILSRYSWVWLLKEKRKEKY